MMKQASWPIFKVFQEPFGLGSQPFGSSKSQHAHCSSCRSGLVGGVECQVACCCEALCAVMTQIISRLGMEGLGVLVRHALLQTCGITV